MADFSISADGIALTSGNIKDGIAIKAPAGAKVKIKSVWCDFAGVTSSDGQVLVAFYKNTTGTGSGGTTLTPIALKNGNPTTSACTVTHSNTAGFTYGNPFESHRWHPTTATRYDWALGDEPEINPGEVFVVRCTSQSSVNVTCGAVWTE